MQLFSQNDEREFKRSYVINFLAAYDAGTLPYHGSTGFEMYTPAKETEHLANVAWDEWVKTIGVQPE